MQKYLNFFIFHRRFLFYYNFYFFTEERTSLANGTLCREIKKATCSQCAKHFHEDSNMDNEDRKCVWVPEFKKCRSKWWAKRRQKDFVETCTGIFFCMFHTDVL